MKFSDILQVQNIPEWCTINKLYQLFSKASWIHHETFDTAYLCFEISTDAYKTIFKFNQTTISFEKLYCDEICSGEIEHTHDLQAKLSVSHVKPFLFQRINDMLSLPFYYDQPASVQQSSLLYVQASCKLTNLDWFHIFPTAFDIYKTVDSPKAFLQFRNCQDAFEAAEAVHRNTFTLDIRGVVTNVFVCCCFVTEKFAKQKVKLHLLQDYNELFKLDNSPDKLYTRVVEHLYS
jgi:hypothetical protein